MKAEEAVNIRIMEKLNTPRAEMDVAKEEITRLTKLAFLDSGKGGDLDPKVEAALKEKST